MQFPFLLKLEHSKRDEAFGNGPDAEEGVRRYVLARLHVSLADAYDPRNLLFGYQRHTDSGRFGFLQYLADALLQFHGRSRCWLFFLFSALRASHGGQPEHED